MLVEREEGERCKGWRGVGKGEEGDGEVHMVLGGVGKVLVEREEGERCKGWRGVGKGEEGDGEVHMVLRGVRKGGGGVGLEGDNRRQGDVGSWLRERGR
jgi:hypothetical protein